MKNILPFLLGAALLPLAAQAQSTSNVVGYETVDMLANNFNLVGLRLQNPIVASSTITGLAGTVVSDSAVDFDATLTAGTVYLLEISSGALDGGLQEVSTWGTASGNTANDLVTPQDLSTLGVVVGDSYSIRALPTLEDIFGTTTSPLTKGFTAATSDVVWIPDGTPGGYDRYFLNTLGVWKNAATNADSPNIPIVYADGVLVEKKATASSLVVSGEVKVGNSMAGVLTGFNALGTVYPAGSTLQNSGLADDITPGFTAATADVVWVPDGAAGYTRYFYNTLGQWKNAGDNSIVTEDVDMTSAVWIERKGADTNVTLNPPTSYSTL